MQVKSVPQCPCSCEACGAHFLTLFLGDMSYGQFLMRSKSGQIRYLDGINDPVFDEVREILKAAGAMSSSSTWAEADYFHEVFGKTVDRDESGEEFSTMCPQSCPRCHSTDLVTLADTVAGEIDVPVATHEHWNSLSESEKREAILPSEEGR